MPGDQATFRQGMLEERALEYALNTASQEQSSSTGDARDNSSERRQDAAVAPSATGKTGEKASVHQ